MDQALRKIVIIGPESTGKSTLCKALAKRLDTLWVEEYAREYLEQRHNEYTYNDFPAMAEGQIRNEDALAGKANRFLFCDTDLYVLKVWSEHKYAKVHAFILEEIAQRRYDGYILCATDMPWAPDPLREYPDLQMRQYFYNIYLDIVQQSGCPFIIVEGNEEQRLAQALNSPLLAVR